MWSIIDQPDAQRFLIPAAALENAAGKYVKPTNAAMAAAVKDMTKTSAGTLQTNYTTTDPAAYPMTMVIYALVPTGGISAAKAAAISRFLDFVATSGQTTGAAPGELPQGYLPLPENLRQQTLKAATEVLDQVGNPKPKPKPSTTPKATKSPSASSSPSASGSGTGTAHSVAVSFSSPDTTGMSWVVLALLIAGAVLLISGPTALVLGSPGARGAIGAGARRIRQTGRRLRNRPRRPTGTWPGNGRPRRAPFGPIRRRKS
jgi:hypothetical protein